MAIKFCPKCMNVIKKKDAECSSCGMLVSDMNFSSNPTFLQKKKETDLDVQVKEKKISKRQKRRLEESKEIDFEKAFFEDVEEQDTRDLQSEENTEENVETENKRKRHKHKPKQKKKSETPEFTIDKDGTFDIETKDVTFFENQEEYSVKKARGEITEEKIKWWEIYKWADKLLARRKIMKEVNKAARVKPDFVSKGKMIILCLLFGWFGVHNFYAGNRKKGWTILIMWAIIIPVVSIDVLYNLMGIFVGGGLGFVVFSLWVYDFACICMNRYKYYITKMQFIKKLNTETRAKLGKKYIDIK